MSTLFEEIERIKTAKDDIVSSIIFKDVYVPDDVSIYNCHELISNINGKRTFTFTIGDDHYGDIECIAEEDMTFGSWYFSDYASELIDTYGLCIGYIGYYDPTEYFSGTAIYNVENAYLISESTGCNLGDKIKDSIIGLRFDYSLIDNEEEM